MYGSVCVPRFYFHVHDGRTGRDDEGLELPDATAAFAEALRAAKELAAVERERGGVDGDHSIEVCDETGRVAATVFFRDL